MTLRDPILYPGEPELVYPASWHKLLDFHMCVAGGETMKPGTLARYLDPGWVCRPHDTIRLHRDARRRGLGPDDVPREVAA